MGGVRQPNQCSYGAKIRRSTDEQVACAFYSAIQHVLVDRPAHACAKQFPKMVGTETSYGGKFSHTKVRAQIAVDIFEYPP